MREMDTIKVSITLFHYLLASAPFGVLRGMGAPHVKGCQCENCRKYQTRERAKRIREARLS